MDQFQKIINLSMPVIYINFIFIALFIININLLQIIATHNNKVTN
jgi:hypothetical protein